jgi:hypothetical protein
MAAPDGISQGKFDQNGADCKEVFIDSLCDEVERCSESNYAYENMPRANPHAIAERFTRDIVEIDPEDKHAIQFLRGQFDVLVANNTREVVGVVIYEVITNMLVHGVENGKLDVMARVFRGTCGHDVLAILNDTPKEEQQRSACSIGNIRDALVAALRRSGEYGYLADNYIPMVTEGPKKRSGEEMQSSETDETPDLLTI